MPNKDKADKVNAIIADLANDLRPLVDRIEKRPLPTTKNNYGEYLALIGKLSRGDHNMGKIVTAALLDAGANHAGVASAYKISFGG